jgi:hypothetical protein
VRQLATAARIRAFLAALGREATAPATVYLTGGSTAVLLGWRESTIDIDVKLVPDRDELLRAIAHLKDELEVNVELASPDLFIPVGRGWEDASPFDSTEGPLTVRHFDLVAQCLAKISRGHERDLGDVAAMFDRGLVRRDEVRRRFEAIEADLYRFPALDAATFRRAVDRAVS